MLYTSAPLSLVLVLNLMNRRRLTQLAEQQSAIAIQELDQKIARQIEVLDQQVRHMPMQEDLASVKKSLVKHYQEVQHDLKQQLKELEDTQVEFQDQFGRLKLVTIRQDLGHLQQNYKLLDETLTQVTNRLQEVSDSTRVDKLDRAIAQLKADSDRLQANFQVMAEQTKPTLTSLQEQINHLNRQFQKLPPPFDSTALKQEVAELIRVVAELVPKRDWTNLVSEIRVLHQQQESQSRNEEMLRRKIQEVQEQLQANPVKTNLTSLQNQINHLNRQFQKLPPPFDSTSLKQEITELLKLVANRVPKRDWKTLVTQIKRLQEQQKFQAQVEETLRSELAEINQQLQTFVKDVQTGRRGALMEDETQIIAPLVQPQRAFQARIEETLQRELRELGAQLAALPNEPEFQAEIEATLRQELLAVNEQLRAYQDEPHYELVFDFQSSAQEWSSQGSRSVLQEALATSQERLILILPWSSQCALDSDLLQQMDHYLVKGRRLELGWCHQAARDPRYLAPINHRWAIQPRQQELQETLRQLLLLKQRYPQNFQFQILGTSENFLVSDRQFAVLGTDDSLMAQTALPPMEIKLRTTDAEVIQQLIQRFEHPELHPNDVAAHWNRAVTRYDLGDKEGALADLDRVLQLTPDDAIAFNYRGLVKFDLKRPNEALADFNRALELKETMVEAYCNRGFVQTELGDQLSSIADYSLAIQYQPDLAIAYFYRGLAGQKFGDYQGALTDYSEAIRFAPEAAPSFYYRGLVRQRLEDIAGALADFATAVTLFEQRGNISNAEKAQKNLERLQAIAGDIEPRFDPIPAAPDALPAEEWAEPEIEPVMTESGMVAFERADEGIPHFFADTDSEPTAFLEPPAAKPAAIAPPVSDNTETGEVTEDSDAIAVGNSPDGTADTDPNASGVETLINPSTFADEPLLGSLNNVDSRSEESRSTDTISNFFYDDSLIAELPDTEELPTPVSEFSISDLPDTASEFPISDLRNTVAEPPETEQLETEQLEIEQPEAEQPETEQPETEQLETVEFPISDLPDTVADLPFLLPMVGSSESDSSDAEAIAPPLPDTEEFPVTLDGSSIFALFEPDDLLSTEPEAEVEGEEVAEEVIQQTVEPGMDEAVEPEIESVIEKPAIARLESEPELTLEAIAEALHQVEIFGNSDQDWSIDADPALPGRSVEQPGDRPNVALPAAAQDAQDAAALSPEELLLKPLAEQSTNPSQGNTIDDFFSEEGFFADEDSAVDYTAQYSNGHGVSNGVYQNGTHSAIAASPSPIPPAVDRDSTRPETPALKDTDTQSETLDSFFQDAEAESDRPEDEASDRPESPFNRSKIDLNPSPDAEAEENRLVRSDMETLADFCNRF